MSAYSKHIEALYKYRECACSSNDTPENREISENLLRDFCGDHTKIDFNDYTNDLHLNRYDLDFIRMMHIHKINCERDGHRGGELTRLCAKFDAGVSGISKK